MGTHSGGHLLSGTPWDAGCLCWWLLYLTGRKCCGLTYLSTSLSSSW
jgi:hypothetical protein